MQKEKKKKKKERKREKEKKKEERKVHFDEENITETKEKKQNKKQINRNCCFYSSFIFITNSVKAYYSGFLFYSLCFLFLTITSTIHHSGLCNLVTTVIDKIACISVFLTGAFVLFNKSIDPSITSKKIEFGIDICFIMIAVFLTFFLYYYGYISNDYCYHDNPQIANIYHVCMHIIASYGHHLIILL